MRYAIRTLAIILAFILECTLGAFLDIQGISPCLTLAVIIVISMETEPLEACSLALLAGVLTDILWGRIFGFNSLLYMYAALGMSFISGEFYKKSAFVTAWTTFLVVIILQVISYIFTYTVFGEGNLPYAFFRYAIPTAAYTSSVQLLLNKPISLLMEFSAERRGRL